MYKTEFPSMQHLARGVVLLSVKRITDDRMAEMEKVNSDLMRSAAMEHALDQADPA